MPSDSSMPTRKAAKAVKTLLSFFPPTQALDQDAYMAAMVQLFSGYPDSLIAKAIDPTNGLPAMSEFAPSLKAAKDFFESFAQVAREQAEERWKIQKHDEQLKQQLLDREMETRNPDMKKRVQALTDELVAHLKSGSHSNPKFIPKTSVMQRPRVFIPTTDYRYQRFVDWAKVAHQNLWQLGKSSDGRDGIWVDHRIWTSHESFTKPTAAPFPKEPKVRTASEIPPLSDAAKATL